MTTPFPITVINSVRRDYISVLDRALAYGDGVFETMTVAGADIPLWRFHYDRLCRGLSTLGIALEIRDLAKHIQAVLFNAKAIALKPMVFKLIVTRGEGGRGYQAPEPISPNLIAVLSPLPTNNCMESGVKVHYCQQQLSPQPLVGIKTLNQLVYVLASQERLGSDCKEGLLFDRQGRLIEATARNIFLVNSRMQLLTPRLNQCGIEGVMRRLIIDIIAPELNISVKQTAITKTDIANARELFLTNSVTHIWPIVNCERRQWRQGKLTIAIKNRLAHFLQYEKRLCYSQHAVMHAALC